MRDLASYFENALSDEKLSIDSKKKFGEDALQRVATQNVGGILDPELNAMETAQTALFGTITNVAVNKAVSESRTKTVDGVVEKFTKRNTKLNQFLELNDVDKQDVYQEFFPQGVQEFTRNVTKENVEQKMAFLVKAITDNTAVAGGAAVLAEYQVIQTDYAKARAAQLGKFSQTAAGRDQRLTAEQAWDDAMFACLLTAAKLHRNQPQKLSLFFNQSILRTPISAAHDGKGRLAGIVAYEGGTPVAGATVHITDGNIADATTASDGSYVTQSLPIGEYAIIISLNGKKLYQGNKNIVDDGDTTLDVITAP